MLSLRAPTCRPNGRTAPVRRGLVHAPQARAVVAPPHTAPTAVVQSGVTCSGGGGSSLPPSSSQPPPSGGGDDGAKKRKEFEAEAVGLLVRNWAPVLACACAVGSVAACACWTLGGVEARGASLKEEVSKGLKETKEEVSKGLKETKEEVTKGVKETKEELQAMKTDMAKTFQEAKEFRDDVKANFHRMDSKMDKIMLAMVATGKGK